VVEPPIRAWRSGTDVQADCEPGGVGYGGVPVHPARLHSHRTFPAQAAASALTKHAGLPTSDLLSHCHRRAHDVHERIAEG
jgi:hypothetical protein